MRLPSYFILLALLIIKIKGIAQADTAILYNGIQARLHYGFIIAHSQAVQNTAGSHPRGIEIELIKQRVDTTSWKLCRCYPAKGWSFSYFDFNNTILGHGISIAYFLEPSYRIGKRAQFRFRGNIGFSYLTKPFHPQKNSSNMSYSTHLSGYAQLGISGTYQAGRQWLIVLGGQYQHVSNGGLKEPNKGINWPTASLGVTWFRQKYNLPVYAKMDNKDYKRQKPYMEAGVFFSGKQGYKPNGQTPRTLLTGIIIQANKQVGRINSLNAGIEFYYDNALNQKLQKDSIDGSAFRLGLLAGHEFLLGKFFFSQQLGIYLLHNNPYYNRMYHRWALRYQLNKHWITGVGFKAHKQVADFIDVRLMYRF